MQSAVAAGAAQELGAALHGSPFAGLTAAGHALATADRAEADEVLAGVVAGETVCAFGVLDPAGGRAWIVDGVPGAEALVLVDPATGDATLLDRQLGLGRRGPRRAVRREPRERRGHRRREPGPRPRPGSDGARPLPAPARRRRGGWGAAHDRPHRRLRRPAHRLRQAHRRLPGRAAPPGRSRRPRPGHGPRRGRGRSPARRRLRRRLAPGGHRLGQRARQLRPDPPRPAAAHRAASGSRGSTDFTSTSDGLTTTPAWAVAPVRPSGRSSRSRGGPDGRRHRRLPGRGPGLHRRARCPDEPGGRAGPRRR